MGARAAALRQLRPLDIPRFARDLVSRHSRTVPRMRLNRLTTITGQADPQGWTWSHTATAARSHSRSMVIPKGPVDCDWLATPPA